MNYLKTYVKLMRKAQQQPEPLTYEKHHVFPKSLYGKNNFVIKLSSRQHYIAHALLYKGLKQRYGSDDFRTKKMMHAFWFMHSLGPRHNGRYTSSRLYETIRLEFIKTLKNRPKEDNPFFGRKHSILTRRKISLNSGGDGQIEGLFEYFEEKFEKVLETPAIRWNKINSKPKISNLDTVLKNLSMAS